MLFLNLLIVHCSILTHWRIKGSISIEYQYVIFLFFSILFLSPFSFLVSTYTYPHLSISWIAKELLQEIPEQVCSYMELNNITLDDIQSMWLCAAFIPSRSFRWFPTLYSFLTLWYPLANAIPTAVPVDAIPTAAPLNAIPTAAPLNAIPTAAPLEAIPTAAPLEAIPSATPLNAIPSATPLNAIPTATPLNTNVSSHWVFCSFSLFLSLTIYNKQSP